MSHRAARSCPLCLSAFTIWCVATSLSAGDQGGAARKLPTRPAEFESQDALLISWNADDAGIEQALAAIVSAVHRNVQVIVLAPDDEYLRDAIQCFSLAGVPRASVRYVRARVDTIWTRDYGPASIRVADGTFAVIDADYETGRRAHDDHLPAAIAPVLGLSSVHVPLTIEGGNLLSNGQGLGIATTKLRDANLSRGYSEERLRGLLRDAYGFSQMLWLEPLDGEPTGHVDMFATFVAPHVVVVGEYDPAIDPINADVLDRNADRLAAVQTPRGRLRVVRVPMPPSGPDVWRTYTNVLYANGTLLVPSYPGITPQYEQEAFDVFGHLLPGWRIVPIDCNQLIALGGGIHCITMNLSRIGRLPRPIEAHEPPAPGVMFPADAAAPRLAVDRVGWQAARIADSPPDPHAPSAPPGRIAIEAATVEPAASDLEIPEECRRCCPPAEAGATPGLRRPSDGDPRDRRLPSDRFALPGGFHDSGSAMFASDVPPNAWRPARPARPLPTGPVAGFERLGPAAAGRSRFAAPRRGTSPGWRDPAGFRGSLEAARLAPGWSD